MELTVTADQVQSLVMALPEMAIWPEVAGLFEPEGGQPRLDWQLPVLACRAVGGDEARALPAVGAIACIKLGFILVDGILDDDPEGFHRPMGVGRAANLGLGLLAAAFALIERSEAEMATKTAVTASLAQMALGGAAGQELDVQNRPGEENYWKVVRAKGSPFYASSLEIGALVGGAEAALARGLYDLGVTFGEMVQVYDDLEDAFKTPANPDWRRGYNNLPILYALTADHPRRERFARLLPRVDDPQVLDEAQRILINCGAVSYCIYHLVQRYQTSQRLLQQLPLADPTPMIELLEAQVAPLREWLHTMGVEIPPELVEQPYEHER